MSMYCDVKVLKKLLKRTQKTLDLLKKANKNCKLLYFIEEKRYLEKQIKDITKKLEEIKSYES